MDIKIDSEFQSLIPPLTDDEYQRLEKSILDEGVREPIITWDGTIIDGHNRYRICKKHGLEFKIAERDFDSRDAVKIWIYGNQLGRRNLEAGQKAALVIERNEAEVRERARLRQVKAGEEYGRGIGDSKNSLSSKEPNLLSTAQEPTPEKGRTAEILAKQAGVGAATIKRVLKVKKNNQELYDKVRNGEVTSMAAYKQVTEDKIDNAKITDDGRRICSICGKPINEGDSYNSKKSVHKKCFDAKRAESQYVNPDKSLIENVAIYNIESLLTQLTVSAQDLQSSWIQSIQINESMGVKLSSVDKNMLEKAAENLINTIEEIRKEKCDVQQ